MAIYHVNTKIISKSKGQSAVAAAAYRSGSKLIEKIIDRKTGVTTEKVWDYSKKKGVVFSQIFVPEEWAGELDNYEREKLWNDVTHKELRKDSQLSRDYNIALPIELTKEQNIDLLTEIATECFVKYGMIADCNMHLDNKKNPHFHAMLTMRELVKRSDHTVDFGLKNRTWNSKLYLMYVRELIAVIINKYLELHGHLSRVSHLSHAARGIKLTPTVHEGPAAYINFSELRALNEQIIAENAAAIRENPELVFDKLSINMPVFTTEAIAKALSDELFIGIKLDREGKSKVEATESDITKEDSNLTNNVFDKANFFNSEELNNIFAPEFMVAYKTLISSDKITLINPSDLRGRPIYTLTKRLELEKKYFATIQEFAAANRHNLGIDTSALDPNIFKKFMISIKDFVHEAQEEVNEKFNAKLDLIAKEHSLTGQQRRAVLEIANGSDLATLEGLPGAGKTKMMKELVRQYRKVGYTVIGAAPSSAAALVLAKATGIEAKNTTMWRKLWQEAKGEKFELPLRSDYYKEEQYSQVGQTSNPLLTNKHVLIIDEASMVELADMDYLISEIKRAGGKCIIVVDNNQFQAIGMRGGSKKSVEIVGASRLTEIMRHKHPDEGIQKMQRLATQLVGEYKIHEALEIYKALDVFRICQNEQEAKRKLVSDYIDTYLKLASSLGRDDLASIRSLVVGTYTNESVDYFNQQIREQLKQAGVLKGIGFKFRSGGHDRVELMVGEQIVFESNKSAFKDCPEILNGEVATVLSIDQVDEFGHGKFTALLHKADGSKQKIVVDTKEQLYPVRFRHGYAVTGYKLQGETADQMLVYFEKVFGYEAFYVLMSRHKYGVILYAANDLLENIVYERMSPKVEEIRKKFELVAYKHSTGKSPLDEDGYPIREAVPGWYVGLALAISKRVDNNFALDYRAKAVLSSNELVIKNYLESRELVFDLQGKMQEWTKEQTKPLPLAMLHKQLSEEFDIKYVKQIHIDANGLMYAYKQAQDTSSNKVDKLEKELQNLQESLKVGSVDRVSYDKAASKAKRQIEFFSDLNKVAEYFATKVAEGKSTKSKVELDRELEERLDKTELEVTLDKLEHQDNKDQQNEVGSLATSNLAASHLTGSSITSDSEPNSKTNNKNNKVKVNWHDLSQKNKNMAILANLPIEAIEELKDIFDKLQEAREERTKYAELICDNYHGVVSKKTEDELRQKETPEGEDLTSEEAEDYKYNSKITMGSILLQLNLNYETILKHANRALYKYFFKSTDDSRTIIANPNWGEMLEICYANSKTTSQKVNRSEMNHLVKQVAKFLTALQEDIVETEATIMVKTEKLAEVKVMASGIKGEIEDIKNFREKLFPEFLRRIYQAPAGEVLDNWKKLVNQTVGNNPNLVTTDSVTNFDDALSVVKRNPQVLGKLRGIGVGTMIGISPKRREVIMNIKVLTTRLWNYQNLAKSQDELNKKLIEGDYENLQTSLMTEIKQLNSSLPNEHEQQFIENLVNLHQEDDLDNRSIALLTRSEDFEGFLYEHYNYQEEVEKMKEFKELANINISNNKSTERIRRRRVRGGEKATVGEELAIDDKNTKSQVMYSVLTFKEVNSQLTEKEYREIFSQYVHLIHSKPKEVIEIGNKLKSGSIQMDLTNGKWTRFSRKGEDGRFLSGDIFAFVGLATDIGAAEQLEIVASVAGINGASKKDSTLQDNIPEEGVIPGYTKIAATTITTIKSTNQWIACGLVPKHAKAFEPKKDMRYLFNDKELDGIFAYRNEKGELLGYTIRPIDKQTGKKFGVLPVTYCHNGKEGKERKEGWYQKGFSDEGGYKPIYGLEKLSQSQNGKTFNNHAPILIVEGEKTADAAQKLLPDYIVISWLGGSVAASKADWRVFAGRNVTIWPDNDNPGFSAGRTIADSLQRIANSCMVVDPRIFDLPEKWDLADSIPKGVNIRSALVSPHNKESIEIIDRQIGAFNHQYLDNKQMVEMLEKEVMSFLVANNKIEHKYVSRLAEELEVISKAGFAEDFLIAGNIAKYCKHMDIPTGSGRGSAVSSLVAYALGIHKIDPIEHNLLFERFLTEKTSKNPDFDFDIAASMKILVENYLCAKYSNATKLSVISQGNKVNTKEQKAEEVIQNHSTEKVENTKNIQNAEQSIEVATENVRRTIHPSGIGMIPDNIKDELPISTIYSKFWTERNSLTIDHKEAEKRGVKKFDLLSSQVIESIDKVEKLVEKQTGQKIDWQVISWNDKATFQLIRSKRTEGVYQLSSDFVKDVCQKIKMNEFYDIVNLLALIRPGARNYISYFADSDLNNSNKQFSDPKGIFKETKGVPLFQEQIMQASQHYLGIPSRETNDFRRELEKGDTSKHPLSSKKVQIKVSMENGLDANDARSLYYLLTEFSKFGYNKSHAVAYAQITFKTAYLKAHYPEIFNEIFKINNKEREQDREQSKEQQLVQTDFMQDATQNKNVHIDYLEQNTDTWQAGQPEPEEWQELSEKERSQNQAAKVNSIFNRLLIQKDKVTTPKEAIEFLVNQQECLSGLHEQVKCTDAASYSPGLLASVEKAYLLSQDDKGDGKGNKLIDDLQRVTSYAIENAVIPEKELTKTLLEKHNQDPRPIYKELRQACEDHYIAGVNSNVKRFKTGEQIKIGNKVFTSATEYLRHEITYPTSEFSNINRINKRLKQYQQDVEVLPQEKQQLQLQKGRSMGGMDV